MSRTPRDSAYMRVVAGGDYDAVDYYATTAAAAFRAGDDVLRAYATAVGAGSPLQRLDSVQIDAREYTSPEPLQRVARVYSFEAMTSRSL